MVQIPSVRKHIVVPRKAVSSSLLRASSPTAGFDPKISVGNKVRRADLQSAFEMGPTQRVIKDGKRGQGYHYQYTSCFGSSLSAMDGGCEGTNHENAPVFFNVCMYVFMTVFATRMESSGLPLAKNN